MTPRRHKLIQALAAVDGRAALLAGLLAGVVSTLVQIALWLAFDFAFPGILLRDARLAAALLLGTRVLQKPGNLPLVLAVATLVHFALSIAYAGGVAVIVRERGAMATLALGSLCGAAIFAVNLYGFTALFPWFCVARDPITFVAHLTFGACAAMAYRRLAAPSRPARTRSA